MTDYPLILINSHMKQLILTIILLASLARSYGQTAEIFIREGLAKYEEGLFEKSIIDFSKAINLNPSLPESYYFRGKAKSKLNKDTSALSDYSKAINYLMNNKNMKKVYSKTYSYHIVSLADTYLERANSKAVLKDLLGQIQDLSLAIDMSETHNKGTFEYSYFLQILEDAYFYRGSCKALIDDIYGSISDYSKVIEMNGNRNKIGLSYYFRGLQKINHQKLFEKENGCLDLSKALEYGETRAYFDIQNFCRNK